MPPLKTPRESKPRGQILIEFALTSCLGIGGAAILGKAGILTLIVSLMRTEAFLKGRALLYQELSPGAQQASAYWPSRWRPSVICEYAATCRVKNSLDELEIDEVQISLLRGQ